jgi:hypothetical protein
MMRFKKVSPGVGLHGRRAFERPMRLDRPAARTAPGTSSMLQILSGSVVGCDVLAKTSAIRYPSTCGHFSCAEKDTRGQGKWPSRRETPPSGDSPKSLGFLDFPPRSPYTDPVFKLSVRPPTGGAARGAGRSGPSSALPGIVRAASSRPFTHRSACRAPGMIRGSAHRRTRVCQRERSRDF